MRASKYMLDYNKQACTPEYEYASTDTLATTPGHLSFPIFGQEPAL